MQIKTCSLTTQTFPEHIYPNNSIQTNLLLLAASNMYVQEDTKMAKHP